MGSTLCHNTNILQHQNEHSYIILENDFQQNKALLNEPLGSRGMDYIVKNNLTLHKMRDQKKYYCGRFQNGKAHGLGIIFIPDRSYYQGELKNGLPDGYGYLKLFLKDEVYQIYQGHFKGGMANGKGKLDCRHNKIYFQFEGQWQNSSAKYGVIKPKFESQVQAIELKQQTKIIRFKNGDIYEGSLNSYFQPNGVGSLAYNSKNNTQSYQGEWFRGKFNGKGKCKWRDGSEYEGQYIDGEKQGEGKFVFASGNYYIGHWLDGYMHGLGTLYNKDGKTLQRGIWIKGKISLAMESTQDQSLKYEQLPIIFENQRQLLSSEQQNQL